jgi:hypothetical protein
VKGIPEASTEEELLALLEAEGLEVKSIAFDASAAAEGKRTAIVRLTAGSSAPPEPKVQAPKYGLGAVGSVWQRRQPASVP